MTQVSAVALQSMMAQHTNEVFVHWIKFAHPSLAAPLMYACDTKPLVRADGTYKPFPFSINLPEDTEDQIPQVQVTLDNIDAEFGHMLRTMQGAPTITMGVSLASQPDVVEAGPYEYTLRQSTVNQQTVQGVLGYEEDYFDQLVPGQIYDPANSPGVYA